MTNAAKDKLIAELLEATHNARNLCSIVMGEVSREVLDGRGGLSTHDIVKMHADMFDGWIKMADEAGA